MKIQPEIRNLEAENALPKYQKIRFYSKLAVLKKIPFLIRIKH